MSIEMEWDVSEAPRDEELAPERSTPQPGQSNAPKASKEPTGRHRPRWLAWLVGITFLAAVAAGGFWYYAQAGWQKISRDLLAAVTYEDQQASLGATNLLLNVQDRGNLDWLTVRRDEVLARQPAPLPLPMLNFDPAPLTLAEPTVLDTQYMQADVSRQFTTPDGQTLTFTLPQFYRRDASGKWLRSAPPGAYWGNWMNWHGANLDIHYSERDAAFVDLAAPVLDAQLAEACAVWVGGCPAQSPPARLYLSGFVGSLEYNPLANVEVRIESGSTIAEGGTPTDYYLSVPSPQIAGIPADAAGRSYLIEYLTVRLIAALARHISTSPDGYFHRTSQAIQALGLSNLDPGYIASGQRRRKSGSGFGFPPPVNDAPTRSQDHLAWRVVWYTTLPGDTLDAIASQFNTSAVVIERANRLGNPDRLAAGVKLIVPILTPNGVSP